MTFPTPTPAPTLASLTTPPTSTFEDEPVVRPSPIAKVAFVVLVCLAVSACNFQINFGDHIEGSGQLTTQTYQVESFTGVRVAEDLSVVVKFAEGPEQVQITVDDNLHEHLRAFRDGDTLVIKPKDNVELDHTDRMVVLITGHKVNSLDSTTNSRVTAELPPANVVSLAASTDASLEVTVHANKLDVRSSTDGSIQVSATGTTEEVNINTSTDASVDLTADATLVTARAGTDSNVSLHGTATGLELTASEDASIHAKATGTINASVQVHTDGYVELNASGTVTGSASTDGEVRINGSANVRVSTSTDGKVRTG